MSPALLIFWAFLALLVVCVTLAGHFGRLETERTLRAAIEKGLPLDAETIARLKRAAAMPWSLRLTVFGVMVLFVAGAVAVFGLILAFNEPESVAPLLAIAAFLALVGAGLMVCGRLLKRAWSGEQP